MIWYGEGDDKYLYVLNSSYYVGLRSDGTWGRWNPYNPGHQSPDSIHATVEDAMAAAELDCTRVYGRRGDVR